MIDGLLRVMHHTINNGVLCGFLSWLVECLTYNLYAKCKANVMPVSLTLDLCAMTISER